MNEESILIKDIKKKTIIDRFTKRMAERINNKKNIKYRDEILIFKGLIYVSKRSRTSVI